MGKELLTELIGPEEAEKLLNEVKKEILAEIRNDLLPISVVLQDLAALRQKNKKSAEILERLLIKPLSVTFEELGRPQKISREHVYRRLHRLSASLPWLAELLVLRGKYIRPNRKVR